VLPRPLAGFKGALLLRGGEGERKRRERKRRGERGRGGMEERERLSHQSKSTKICPV